MPDISKHLPKVSFTEIEVIINELRLINEPNDVILDIHCDMRASIERTLEAYSWE